MKEVLQKNSPAVATGVQQNENDDQGKAASSLQTKKSDSEIVRENEECPPKKEMDKMLDDLPPFTYNSIVKYVRNSGKNIQHSPDYMVMKPFQRGVNFLLTVTSTNF